MANTTTNKASKATQKAADMERVLTDTATASENASKAADKASAKEIQYIYTEKTKLLIDTMLEQVAQYDENDLTKDTKKKIAFVQSVKIPSTASEKTIAEYDGKQAERIAEIFDILTDIDEKKTAKAEKEAERAKYAGMNKLAAKQSKAFADYIAGLAAKEIKPLALRQAANTIPVGQFLDMVQNGQITIPSTQRGCVWTAEQIVKLFDSLINNYPIPALTTLASGGKPATLIDGLQRYTAILTICDYLAADDSQTATLDSIKAAYITINQITLDNSTIEIESDIFARLNNGTAMNKAVINRNQITDKNTLFLVRDSLKNIAKNALNAGINLNKSGQVDGLTMYALAQAKAEKVTSLAPKANAAMIDNFSYTPSDTANIFSVFAAIDKIIDILAATPFKGNIFNQNTLASCIYALLKLDGSAEKIAENLQKIYTNKQGEPSKNGCDRWTMTTKSGGTSASNIEARAKLLIK